jgi:hypothetical protein
MSSNKRSRFMQPLQDNKPDRSGCGCRNHVFPTDFCTIAFDVRLSKKLEISVDNAVGRCRLRLCHGGIEAGRRGAGFDILKKLKQPGAALQQVGLDRLFHGFGVSRHQTVDHVQITFVDRLFNGNSYLRGGSGRDHLAGFVLAASRRLSFALSLNPVAPGHGFSSRPRRASAKSVWSLA